nr:hypothetical protein [Tanacetum cinerariifolium]
MTLNEQILDLNKQLSKEKSAVSFLLEENKTLKYDFKTYEDELLDKQIQLKKKIKELNNILLKTGYQNPFYLKQAQKKQQSLYDGKVLLEKHDPPVVHDSEETLQLAQESRDKMKQMNKEIKQANYTKINHLSGDDTTPSVARKFLDEEADDSLAKHKALELEIERLLREVVSQDIISVVQNESAVDTSDLQTELEHTKERFENCVNNDKVIASGMFRINPSKTSGEEKHVPNTKCLISVNHDKCLRNYVNGKNSRGKKQKAKVSFKENEMKYQPKVTKPKKVEHHKSLATPKPRKSRLLLRWLPTGKLFDKEGKIVDSRESKNQFDCSNGDNACCSKHMIGNLKLLINFVWKFMGTVRFENDHVAAILGFGQFCDSDLEVAFRRNDYFVKNLKGVHLLKGDRSKNLYTINLHEMAAASPICLMAHASSTKS